jgi:RNA polymerase sigma-70 factor (ECF subfamily)
MGTRSDAELVAAFRGGDEAALEAIFERYEQPLFLFLLGILRDHHRAEDALQETFVQALEGLDGVDPDHLRGWLFTVAYHRAMLVRRQLGARRRYVHDQLDGREDEMPGRDRDPHDAAVAREEADWCSDLLRQLPASQREVIRLRLYEGKRFREIAADLGCPLSTALARMHQGLQRLRVLGGRDHESP